MLIKDPSQATAIPKTYQIDYQKDNLVTSYIENTELAQEVTAIEVKESDNGFTDQRTMQHLAHIPQLLYEKMCRRFGPDWIKDDTLFSNWLKSEEGKPFKIARNP